MKKQFQILLISIGFFSFAHAGGESSGGGGAFVCRDAQGHVTSSELLDLWEMQNIVGLKVTESDESVDGQIEKALAKMEPLAPVFVADIRKELVAQRPMFTKISSNIKLNPPPDALAPYGKPGCPLEGMMYYNNDLNQISFDEEIFSHLQSKTQVAAAYLHEAIYKILRQDPNANANSILARGIVGDLFSKYQFGQPEKPVDRLNRILTTPPDNFGYLGVAKVLSCQNVNRPPYSNGNVSFYYFEFKTGTFQGTPRKEYPLILFSEFESQKLSNVYTASLNYDFDYIHVVANNLDFYSYVPGARRYLIDGSIDKFKFDSTGLNGEFWFTGTNGNVMFDKFECKPYQVN